MECTDNIWLPPFVQGFNALTCVNNAAGNFVQIFSTAQEFQNVTTMGSRPPHQYPGRDGPTVIEVLSVICTTTNRAGVVVVRTTPQCLKVWHEDNFSGACDILGRTGTGPNGTSLACIPQL
jgi:hypothetical protein